MKTLLLTIFALVAFSLTACKKCEECTVDTRSYVEFSDPSFDLSDFGLELETNSSATDEYCDDDLEDIKATEGTDVVVSIPSVYTQYLETRVDCD